MKKSVIVSFKIIFVCTIFYFIGRMILDNWHLIKDYPWEINYKYLIVSYLFLSASLLFAVLSWYLVLVTLDVRLPFLEVARIWFIAQLGRFLPGYVWAFVGRVTLLAEKGVSKKRAALSTYLEAALSVLAATLVVIVSMIFTTEKFSGISMPLLSVAAVGCLVLLHPKVLEIALNFMFRLLRRERVKVEYRYFKMLAVTGSFLACWILLNIGFFFMVKSVYALDITKFFNVAIAFTASWVIGFLTIFSPAGLGVREGFLIMFLNMTLPRFLSPVISIVARLWMITGELFTLAIVTILYRFYFKSKQISNVK